MLRRVLGIRRLRQLAASLCLLAAWLMSWRVDRPEESLDTDVIKEEDDLRVKVYAPTNSTSNVAVCLIVYNETLYLDEWLEFHIALGFSPIFIYDNSPYFQLMTEPHGEFSSWYESREDIKDYVRLIHFPTVPVQHPAYDRCLKRDAAESTFAAMIDVDEFLILKKFDNVVDLMDHHCDFRCGQLSINWHIMGVSGQRQYSPVPVVKRNVHYQEGCARNGTIKVIVRPSYVADKLHWDHSVMLKRGRWVDTNGKVHAHPLGSYRRAQNAYKPFDVAVLYHYPFRSDEEFRYKTCARGTSLHERGVLPMCNNPKYYRICDGTEFDDAAWKQLTRMLPKYRIYGEANNASLEV
ncbi:hypothetical protein ACHAWF_017008 [Thalassiosira exigua]